MFETFRLRSWEGRIYTSDTYSNILIHKLQVILGNPLMERLIPHKLHTDILPVNLTLLDEKNAQFLFHMLTQKVYNPKVH